MPAPSKNWTQQGGVEFCFQFEPRSRSKDFPFASPSAVIVPLSDLRLLYWLAADPDGPIEPWWYRRFRDQRLVAPHDRGPLVDQVSHGSPLEIVVMVPVDLAKQIAEYVAAAWSIAIAWEVGRGNYLAARRRRKDQQRKEMVEQVRGDAQTLKMLRMPTHSAEQLRGGQRKTLESTRRRCDRYEETPVKARATYFDDVGFEWPSPRPPGRD